MLAGKCYWGNKSKFKYIIMRSEFLIKNRLEREKSERIFIDKYFISYSTSSRSIASMSYQTIQNAMALTTQLFALSWWGRPSIHIYSTYIARSQGRSATKLQTLHRIIFLHRFLSFIFNGWNCAFLLRRSVKSSVTFSKWTWTLS